MLRTFSALLVGTVVLVAPVRAAEPAADASPKEIRDTAAMREMIIAQKYRDFEQALVRLAQRLEKSSKPEDREKARVLQEAISRAGQSGINVRFEKLIGLLRESKSNNLAEIKDAIEHGDRIAKEMREMLALLMKDSDLESNRKLQKRLAELIKMLEALIRAQKIVRGHTEKNSMDMPELRKAQDKITKDTDGLANDMEDKDKPGVDRLPGKDLVRKAVQDETSAGTSITADNRVTAAGHQTQAIDKLMQVRDALIKLLKQLHDDEVKAILASLQARCERMLQMQIEVRDGTVDVARTIGANADQKPTRVDHQKSLGLSGREGEIAAEAKTAIAMVEEEGSAVAFLEVFRQLSQDMQSVQRRLGKTDVGTLTQNIEQDIIDTLKEMIAALKEAQRPQPPNPNPPTPPNDPRPPQDGRLLKLISELKLIRSMQLKINKRTESLGRDEPQSSDAETRRDLRELAERQGKIQQVTRDIAVEKNK
jgi:hypothetical protein